MKMRKSVWPAALAAFFTVGVVNAAEAAEQDIRVLPAQAPDDEDVDEPDQPAPTFIGYHPEPSKFGLGLEGYAGIAGQFTSEADRAHGLLGVLLRARLHYFQIGGTFEVTDSGRSASLGENRIEHWRAIGGFVGGFFPFRDWVDFDGAIGVSQRAYINDDPIYGPGGFTKGLTELTLRFGVSDRMSHKLFAARLGAALALGFDLGRQNAGWQREYLTATGDTARTTGSTSLGGVSVGLVVGAGLEFGGRGPFKGF
jgi:hypothetical protein